VSRPRKHDRHLPAYVRIKHGSYEYRGRKVCRVAEGEARLYEALAKLKAPVDLQRIPAAVEAFKLAYLPTLSVSWRGDATRLLGVFADEFEEYRVDQVAATDVTRSIDNLYTGKATSAKHYKACISKFFRWAITKKGLVKLNPCREVELEAPITKKSRWTDALFWAVRARLNPMQQCFHDLTFLVYQRSTEVRLLRRAQDLGGVIHFEPTKTRRSSGKEVDVPVTPAIRQVLDRAAAISKEWGVVCPFVIHTRQGTPYTQPALQSAYARADAALHEGRRIGLKPKSMRPYAATSAKKQGYTKEQIQVGLAHTTIRTTEGYIQHHEVPVSAVMLELPKRG